MIHKEEFLKCFNEFSAKHGRYQVFSDFVTMGSASLHNAVHHCDEIESEYMSIVGKYNKKEVERICKLFSHVILGLEESVCDFLGDIYMSLEFGNARAGQFFTPWSLSKMMASMCHSESLAAMDKEFITFSDPACGAGCMAIAFSETMREAGHNPQKRLWVQCWDVDSLVARMCYIQLSLLHIPAEIVIGNSLTLEVHRVMRTPAYYLGFWSSKLRRYDTEEEAMQLVSDNPISEPIPGKLAAINIVPDVVVDGGQFELAL